MPGIEFFLCAPAIIDDPTLDTLARFVDRWFSVSRGDHPARHLRVERYWNVTRKCATNASLNGEC